MIHCCAFSLALILNLLKNQARFSPSTSSGRAREYKIRPGSIVLTTLILMTALVVIVHSALRASSYFMLLAREREIGEKGML